MNKRYCDVCGKESTCNWFGFKRHYQLFALNTSCEKIYADMCKDCYDVVHTILETKDKRKIIQALKKANTEGTK